MTDAPVSSPRRRVDELLGVGFASHTTRTVSRPVLLPSLARLTWTACTCGSGMTALAE